MAQSKIYLNKKQHKSLVYGYVRNIQQLLINDIIPQPIADVCFRFYFIRKYRIQKIYFNGHKTHRLVEREGGTSALLGLCNILLLNNDVRVNQKVSSIEFKDLTWCLKDHLHKLFEVNFGSKNGMEATETANAIQNIEDSVNLFPQLDEKLDINIKFDDSTGFEYAPATALFDVYNVRLFHGLCVDPANTQLYQIMKHKTYKQIVDYLASDNCSNEKRQIVTEFLSNQLTEYGLKRIKKTMTENEAAVFFHNDFFSVIYKREGDIWKLVTNYDIICRDSRTTWQLLTIDDEKFVSNKFECFTLEETDDKPTDEVTKGNEMDDAMLAERIAIEQQLGLNPGELDQLEQEQRDAMAEWAKEQQSQIKKQNQQKYDDMVRSISYNITHNNTAQTTQSINPSQNTRNQKQQKKPNDNKLKDNCVVM